MNPYLFGETGKTLFGAYYPPTSHVDRNVGILFCYPMGDEYMRTHWTFRQLAVMLNKEGFHIFKFDYYGTGDSSGNSCDGSIVQWESDILTAIHELKEVSGVSQISMIGLRLGGALATLVASQEIQIQDIVLWDPVIKGQIYIDELNTIQRKKNIQSIYAYPYTEKNVVSSDEEELLGYRTSTLLKQEINQIDLLALDNVLSNRMFLIVSEERKEYLLFRNYMKEKNWEFALSVCS